MSESDSKASQELVDWKSLPHAQKITYLPEKMWRAEGFVPKQGAVSQRFLIDNRVVTMYCASEVERLEQGG